MGSAPLSVQARALRRAADILGGKDKLRATLRVPLVQLEHWLEGKSPPPMDVFLKAVDIVSAPVVGATPPAAAVRARVPAERAVPKLQRFLETAFRKDDVPGMLLSALDAAIEATHAQMGNVQLKTPEGLRIVVQRGFNAPFLEFFSCVTDAGCACGTALKNGGRVIVNDVANDPIFVGTEASRVMAQAGARAVQSTPLISVSGQVLGMMSTHFDRPHRPADGELALVDQLAETAASWLEASKG